MLNEWVEVSLPVTTEQEDEVAALFVWAGAMGVEVRDTTTLFAEDRGTTRVVAYIEQGTEKTFMDLLNPVLAASLDQPEEELAERFRMVPITRQEWNEFWKKAFDLQRIGHFVIRPSWKEVAPEPGDTVFVIDPGMAFGTGLHATTRLVMEAIEQLHASGFRPTRILDMGAGTGILSMAAASLFPEARIWAVDNDPDAVETAAEVIANNGLSDRIQVGLSWSEAPVDLVLANIQRDVLLELNPLFQRNLDPGGRMVFSGILNDQIDEIREKTNLPVVRSWHEGEWELVVFEKPATGG
ncbi:50S ribosomal protein L11 methyltransferase [Myxococcota bacterium]|nr:50S ribosomal protein L11 methyltransferase [Myxococcota bacterium]